MCNLTIECNIFNFTEWLCYGMVHANFVKVLSSMHAYSSSQSSTVYLP